MNDHDSRRVEDVRGEPIDELRFIVHLLYERLHDSLPPEFWQHARLARKELRAALLILLRAAVEHLAREDAEDQAEPVSEQRGKIEIDLASPPAPSTNGAHAPDETLPPSMTGAPISPQRSKISLHP